MADTSNSKLFKASFSKRHSSIISDIYGEEIFKEKFDIEKVNVREQLYYKKMIEMKEEMKEKIKKVRMLHQGIASLQRGLSFLFVSEIFFVISWVLERN